jgi:hypothetical protein
LSKEHQLVDNLYKDNEIDLQISTMQVGKISDRDKFTAAKQILLGIAILYIITITAFLIRPIEGVKLLDIATIIFPPLATLILAAYFRDKST